MTPGEGAEVARARWNERHRAAGPDLAPPSRWLTEHAGVLDAQPRGRALDLACGRGRNALFLAARGFEVDALDISDVAIEQVERHAREHRAPITAHRVDLGDEPASPCPPYAVVLNLHFLERRVLPMVEEVLAPGGLVFFEAFVRDRRGERSAAVDPRFLLEPGELLAAFPALRVLEYREAVGLGDPRGRQVATLLARRPDALPARRVAS